MKRNHWIFINSLLMLCIFLLGITGCKNKNFQSVLKTYNIKDNKVEINSIIYDISSVTKTTYKYDDDNNIIEKVITDNRAVTRIEYLYENGQLTEEKRYNEDVLSHTTYFEYENELLISQRMIFATGKEMISEYSYGEKSETVTHYNSDGSIGLIAMKELNSDNRILKVTSMNEDGKVIISGTFKYKDNLLVESIRSGEGIYNTRFNYEYNDVGDKVMEYVIFYYDVFGDGNNTLETRFYDYEYDKNSLPKTVTTYEVRSSIAEEDIRTFY